MDLLARLTSDSPKRILALDGGGVRGILALAYLERIEQLLRTRHGRDDLRLRDYFDLIGGTSTGAIIAAGLAIGLSAAEVKQRYLELAQRIFGRKRWWRWISSYDERPLAEGLAHTLGDRTLGDPSLTTGLCIFAKRVDTSSIWPLINHPRGKFYDFNKDIKLRDVVRASTAAPTFFVPQLLNVGGEETGAFIDGAVSTANNPALHLFLVATLRGFPFHWRTGEERLLLTSVGTGLPRRKSTPQEVLRSWLADWAYNVPPMLIEDCNWQAQVMLQYLSRSPTAWPIDLEIGDLRDDLLTREPALSYLRYDIFLDKPSLAEIGVDVPEEMIPTLSELTRAAGAPLLARIGAAAAEAQVQEAHFPRTFDLAPE